VDDPESPHHEDLDFVQSLLHSEARPRSQAEGKLDLSMRMTAAWRSIWDRKGVVYGECSVV
jgi:hypothetical protein